MRPTLLEPGRTCWRIARADQLAFIVDAADYFEAVADAIERAQHSVLILGWDIHSRVRLRRDAEDEAGELGRLLDNAARHQPSLRVHMLLWDYSMVFTLEREFLPLFQLGWKTHPHVKIRFGSDHPLGGSLHQKVVVVDDALAFVGGIDLTIARWDRREHERHDPKRRLPGGDSYPPFHDVQVAVTGPAAQALGELARERWRQATGESIEPCSPTEGTWPDGLSVDLRDADVALARTRAPFGERPAIREVERLHLESIAAARDVIYIENQYLTAESVCDALAARLEQDDGPEVVIVTPRDQSGRLEEMTMGALRAGFVQRLRSSDSGGRLRVLYPTTEGEPAVPIQVHAKVMVVDDELVRVGSSNLSPIVPWGSTASATWSSSRRARPKATPSFASATTCWPSTSAFLAGGCATPASSTARSSPPWTS